VVTNEPDARTEGPPGHQRGSGGRGWTLQNREASNLAAGCGSYSQHNTVIYKEGDQYRGMPHRNTILINRADIARAGFTAHQRVTVQGEAGALQNVEIIPGEIRAGAALMFYPEVNAIFKAVIDSRSGTPAFKLVPVLVRGGRGGWLMRRRGYPSDSARLR
jgi:hypothetical protein